MFLIWFFDCCGSSTIWIMLETLNTSSLCFMNLKFRNFLCLARTFSQRFFFLFLIYYAKIRICYCTLCTTNGRLWCRWPSTLTTWKDILFSVLNGDCPWFSLNGTLTPTWLSMLICQNAFVELIDDKFSELLFNDFLVLALFIQNWKLDWTKDVQFICKHAFFLNLMENILKELNLFFF